MFQWQLFDFAINHRGQYQNSIPVAGKFYSSSGYEDELLWAASWLHRATRENTYADYVYQNGNSGGTRTMFSWDDKYVGAQILMAKNSLNGKYDEYGNFAEYKNQAEQYICNCIGKGSNNVQRTPSGLLWWQPWNNLQYVSTAVFVTTTYADYLGASSSTLHCQVGEVSPHNLINFVRSQVDHILGSNPKGMSYMVGFGQNYPRKVHHRGASIVSINQDSSPVSCKGGYEVWFNKEAPNPNVLEGAIVGGPDQGDNFSDSRSNYQQAEPATANSAPLDELLWAASWLHRATRENTYADYVYQNGNSGGTRTMFSWDDKYVGAQILMAKTLIVTSSFYHKTVHYDHKLMHIKAKRELKEFKGFRGRYNHTTCEYVHEPWAFHVE
ncbi:unnamed protein product [Ilex paraguariensis]|uniref:Endoglucanase n=1 Tax=Ilex paraguariensis TaxID=185542 RepID=A0ABC8TRM2_9AQUA